MNERAKRIPGIEPDIRLARGRLSPRWIGVIVKGLGTSEKQSF